MNCGNRRSCLISHEATLIGFRTRSYEDGEGSAKGRRPVIQTLFQQKTRNGRPSRGNAGIKGCCLQDAALHHLRHPIHSIFCKALPNLLRRRVLVNRPYSTCRRTLKRAIAGSHAHRQCKHREQYYKRAPTLAPRSFEICELQHAVLTGLSYVPNIRSRMRARATRVTAVTPLYFFGYFSPSLGCTLSQGSAHSSFFISPGGRLTAIMYFLRRTRCAISIVCSRSLF